MDEPREPLHQPSHLPEDAQHLGLLPVTAPELQVASALRADKPLHRLIAWIGLLVVAGGVVWSIVAALLSR